MHRLQLWMPAIAGLALLGATTVGSHAASSPSRAALTYSDPGFTFAYPSGWKSLSPSVVQRVTAPFAGFKREMHVTDAGGVSTGRGQGVASAIVVMRFRLSHATRLAVEKNRSGFIRSFLNGVALSARRIVHQGPSAIGRHQANEIEFMQGSGAIRLHQLIYVLLSSDAKRMYLVYFIAPKRDWTRYLPAFAAAAASMRFSPSP